MVFSQNKGTLPKKYSNLGKRPFGEPCEVVDVSAQGDDIADARARRKLKLKAMRQTEAGLLSRNLN